MVKMKKPKAFLFFLLAGLQLGWSSRGLAEIKIAVEFNNHAASAYVAQAKGWFEEEGIKSVTYEAQDLNVGMEIFIILKLRCLRIL